jgi:hypothetical protein
MSTIKSIPNDIPIKDNNNDAIRAVDRSDDPTNSSAAYYVDPSVEAKIQDGLLYGGLHRRFYPSDGALEQTQAYVQIQALRPAHRPGKTTVDHGVFATYNDYADEGTMVMTDRMCEGTYGDGKYPLHYAAYKGRVANVNRHLRSTLWRKSGADIQVEDHLKGRTALHVACSYGRQDICEALLKSGGANLNVSDYWGWSPLMYAVHSGHEELVRWLVSRRGAWLSVHGNRHETAYDLSQIEHRGHVAQRYALTEFIRNTEDNVTAQSAANGWKGSFGTHVHSTRPKPKYRKLEVLFPLDGKCIVLKYRVGDFGLQWATRVLHFERMGRPDDNTMLSWATGEASRTAYEAAVRGCVKGVHSVGFGKPMEDWMKGIHVGTIILELVCTGGKVKVHENEQQMLDMLDVGMKVEDGTKEQDALPLEAVRIEIPVPDGIHTSFMLRMINEKVSSGKIIGKKNWEKEEEERERASRKKPNLMRRMSTMFLGGSKRSRRKSMKPLKRKEQSSIVAGQKEEKVNEKEEEKKEGKK